MSDAAMVRVGIVGGLGPESTIDYYRRILELWQRDDPSTMPANTRTSCSTSSRRNRRSASSASSRPAPMKLAGVGCAVSSCPGRGSLGGTELPLLLEATEIAGVPALDTTALHVAAIVRRMREGDSIGQAKRR